MKKTIAAIIDELISTNIKIHHLVEKIQRNEHTPEDAKKSRNLNKYRLELCKALNMSTKISTTMKKTVATIIDELISTNIKIYHLVEKVQNDEHTREEAKKIQDLNSYRSELCNALNKGFKEREIIKT